MASTGLERLAGVNNAVAGLNNAAAPPATLAPAVMVLWTAPDLA
eukprot:SAG31_NODE_11965_length_981_cov_1.383220_1_plen_43_part_01